MEAPKNPIDPVRSWWDINIPTIAGIIMAIVLIRQGDPSGVEDVTTGGTKTIESLYATWEFIVGMIAAVVSSLRAIWNGLKKAGKI